MSLQVEVEVTFKKLVDLETLIRDGYIDEDALVEALDNNDHTTINRLFSDITRHNDSKLYNELASDFQDIDTSKKSVSIIYGGQELKSNMNE